MKFGCAWYPEHWSEARWAQDLGLMREAGMNVVRVAEFAWSRMEPEEGRFELDWLERAIALAARHGLETVIGTPSAAPPAWLTQKYPDTLAIRETGRPAQHGNRCHFSPASQKYRELCGRIAERMSARFGKSPHVIGWQIDNEYSTLSYDPESLVRFQEFLRKRYRTLDELNARWTTDYWSQTYNSWDQIPMPIGGHNPALLLELRRFVTLMYVEYQKVQIDAIRKHSDLWITHNFMGWFDLFDHYDMSRDLELASWDSYVGTGHLDPLANGSAHDVVRGFKRKNFWLMETQPGNVNWQGVNNALDRGEVRTMAWHAIGHGADAVLYWQWRSALGGQEQYHGSIVAPDGQPRPLYREIREIGADLAKCGEALDGTSLVADCAILHSYDDRWAISFQKHHKDFDPVPHLNVYYRALRQKLDTVDIVHPTAPLEGYKLVVAPNLHLLERDVAERLERFVRGGGHLVLGPRSGMKDWASALLESRQPGPLAALLGAHVEEYYVLDSEVALVGEAAAGGAAARIWAEWLEVDANDAEVQLRYGAFNGWIDGRAAVVSRKVDAGRITYVGAWLDDATMRSLATTWIADSGARSVVAPDGVEISRRVDPRGVGAGMAAGSVQSRSGSAREVWIYVNHGKKTANVAVPFAARDLIGEKPYEGDIALEPRQVAVLVPR